MGTDILAALRRFFMWLFIVTLVSAIMAASLAFYGFYYYRSPGPLAQDSTVIFKRGEGFQAIADDMAQAGIITEPLLFKSIAVASGQFSRFKAGEYRFTAAMNPQQVMEMIAAGRVVVHKITIPEGLTVQQVIQLLKNEPALDGDVSDSIAEGSLMPQTYHFTYGDKRQDVITRMQASMASQLNELWQKRKDGLPFTTPEQALILASIVEKETGVDSERGHVASVFINRLKKGIKLQSDPTVTYGLDKSGKLDHVMTLGDLHSNTPYNTYLIPALPPTPIANPGRAALEAVLNPPDTNDLYFVATGTGGHNFAATLEEHNANVKLYREKRSATAPANAAQ